MTHIVAGTGHRSVDCESEEAVRKNVREFLESSGADVFICGMANGFDLWAGDEARLLGIEVWAAKPWTTHKAVVGDEQLYASVLEYASKVVNVVESDTFPGPWAYHLRNEWMVDHANEVVSYWNGKEAGGTFACRNYAHRKEVPVTNVY